MGKTEKTPRRRPATTPEERIKLVTAAAYDLAEQQILDGTASPSVITHFLRMGSPTAQLEKEQLEIENELLKEKINSLKQQQSIEALYTNAIDAMRRYSGQDSGANHEVLQ